MGLSVYETRSVTTRHLDIGNQSCGDPTDPGRDGGAFIAVSCSRCDREVTGNQQQTPDYSTSSWSLCSRASPRVSQPCQMMTGSMARAPTASAYHQPNRKYSGVG
jgi:hypothetical protein